jgi:NAD(P)H-nitrite reductase large subunit
MKNYIKAQKTLNGEQRFTLTPNISSPFISPDIIIHIGEMAKKYGGVLKLGANQKISIINLKENCLENILKDLEFDLVPKNKYLLTNITLCTSNFCKMSKYPTIGIYMKIVNKFYKIELPAKTKIGISSCKNSCNSAYTKDIGVLVDKAGKFFITMGGRASTNPKAGYNIASELSESGAISVIKNTITYYKSNANENEKLRDFIDRIGLDLFIKMCVK